MQPPPGYQPLSETGWKDIWIPSWPLHQPWRRQTRTTEPSHSALDLDWRVGIASGALSMSMSHFPKPWHSCTDWLLLLVQSLPLWLTGGSCTTMFAPSSFYKIIERYSISFATFLIVLTLWLDPTFAGKVQSLIDYVLQRFDEEVLLPLLESEETVRHQFRLK